MFGSNGGLPSGLSMIDQSCGTATLRQPRSSMAGFSASLFSPALKSQPCDKLRVSAAAGTAVAPIARAVRNAHASFRNRGMYTPVFVDEGGEAGKSANDADRT